MRKEFALIMVSCLIGISSAYGDVQVNIEQSPGQVTPPVTVTDSSSNVLFKILSDGRAIINEFIQFSGDGLTSIRNYVFPDSSGTIVIHNATQTLTAKTINASKNTITDIDNDEIKSNAGIDVTKLNTGIVDNTEFDSLDGVTSDIQSQLDSKVVPSIVRLGSDVSTSSTTCCVDATGLSFDVLSGEVYHFKFLVRWETTNDQRGIGLTLNGPTTTLLTYDVIYPRLLGPNDEEVLVYNSYDTPDTTPRSTTLTDNLVIIEGLIQPSADGTLIVRFVMDNSGGGAGPHTITIKENSVGFLTEIP